MTRREGMLFSVVASLLLLAAAKAPADEAEQGAVFTGQFAVGYRTVSVDGQDNKYREDYNLQKGPRLFNLSLLLKPTQQLRGFADRIQLDVNNYGGDPFESLRLGVQKHGTYNFQYTRTKDTYFYNDIILPESLANSRAETGGDFRTFNFDRVRDLGKLDVTVNRAVKLHFNFDRYTKLGTSTQPMDFARDGYEFTRPIDETQNQYGAGADFSWHKVTLSLQESVRDYQNMVELFLPGASRGADPTNADVVENYTLTQPYDFKSYDHTVRLVAHPNKRWIVKASVLLQRLNLDVSADQQQQGTNYNGQPLSPAEATGTGTISRDANLFDLDTTYMFNDHVGVLASGWYRKLKQDGTFTFADAPNQGQWDLRTGGGRAGVEVDLASQVTITAGLQYDNREVKNAHTEGSDLEQEPTVTTKDTGVFGSLGWVPSKRVRVNAELETSSYTDPFTLKSPTSRQRVRLRARYDVVKGLYLAGSFLYNRSKNNDSGWDGHYNQANLRVGYQGKAVTASAGYGYIDIKRDIAHDIDVIDTTTLLYFVPIAYDARTSLVDGQVRWTAYKGLGLGGDLRYYTNSGSWPLMHDDFRVYAEYTFSAGYLVHAGYRYLKYNEKTYNFDDYSANIGEFSIGYRWQ